MKRSVRHKITHPVNLFAWLLIGLIAGQGPLVAFAECCGERAGAEMASCCCAEMTCTAPVIADAVTWAPPSDDCGCLEESVPLPYHDPNPPAERSEIQVRVLEPGSVASVQPALERSGDGGRYSWPPGAAASTRVFIRTVVLLV